MNWLYLDYRLVGFEMFVVSSVSCAKKSFRIEVLLATVYTHGCDYVWNLGDSLLTLFSMYANRAKHSMGSRNGGAAATTTTTMTPRGPYLWIFQVR